MTRFQPSPRPDTTPWGTPDRADQVLHGIWRVSTPSHGGYVLSDERQAAMPEAISRADPFYEEDVDYALVLYGFASEFRRLPVPGIALQVEPDRALAAVGADVRRAVGTRSTRPAATATERITFGRFDLDYLRTEIRNQLSKTKKLDGVSKTLLTVQ